MSAVKLMLDQGGHEFSIEFPDKAQGDFIRMSFAITINHGKGDGSYDASA